MAGFVGCWRVALCLRACACCGWAVCRRVLRGVLVLVLGVWALGMVVRVLGRSRGLLVGLGLGGVAAVAVVAGRSGLELSVWTSWGSRRLVGGLLAAWEEWAAFGLSGLVLVGPKCWT